MTDTLNHEYNVPDHGSQDWHSPLNENFEAFEADIELREVEANLGEYTPTEGTKFLATDTGVVYVGDGADWVAQFVHPGYDASADSGGLAVVERSTDHLVVEDLDGEGECEFSYTVRGTRDGYEDKQVVREPSTAADGIEGTSPAESD